MRLYLIIIVISLQTIYTSNLNISRVEISLNQNIGQVVEVSIPYNLTQTRSIKMSATQFHNNNNVVILNEPVCKIRQPYTEIMFSGWLGYYQYQYYRDVITTYQQLIQSRFFMDMVVCNNFVYLVFKDGYFRKIQILENQKKDYQEKFKLWAVIPSNPNLSNGNFIVANGSVYFMNPDLVFKVGDTDVIKIDGYISHQEYESSCYIPDYHMFAVTDGQKGVAIYKIESNNTITLKHTFQSNYFNQSRKVDVADIGFNENLNKLYVIDRINGIFQISLNQHELEKSFIKLLADPPNCENMQIKDNFLYVTCPRLHVVPLVQDDRSFVKVYPDDKMRTREIVIFEDYVFLLGTNVIKVYYDGVMIGLNQGYKMESLRVYKDELIVATDFSVQVGKIQVQKEKIECGFLRNKSMVEGKYKSLINVVAQCNQQYYQDHRLDFSKTMKQQICKYAFPIELNLRQVRQFSYIWIWIMIGVVIAVFIILTGCLVWKIRKQKYLENELNYLKMPQEMDPEPVKLESENNQQRTKEVELKKQFEMKEMKEI